MKKIIPSLIVIVFLFAACNSGSDKAKETKPAVAMPNKAEATDTTIKPVAEQLYACSMHPEVTGKKDEKCSRCGMKLTEPVSKK